VAAVAHVVERRQAVARPSPVGASSDDLTALRHATFFNGEPFVLQTDRFFRDIEEKPCPYLLHVKFWQAPFHLLGGGPKPSSEKDGESGHMPVSSMPTMTSPSSGSSSLGV